MSNIENLPPVPNQPAEMPDQPPVIGHSGELEGGMREIGLNGAQKIEPGIQAPDTVYAGFETRPPEPQERGLMDQAKAAVRDSHAAQTAPEQPPRHTSFMEWIREHKTVSGIAGGVAGLALFLTAEAGMNSAAKGGNQNETLPPQPTTSASAPVTPGQQEKSPSPTETATAQSAALELKKDMTNEEAAKTVVGILSEWGMAGANEDLYKEMMTTDHMTKYGQTKAERERFAADVAARSDDIYIKKLLGNSYDQNNPANIKLINDLKQDHATNLYNFIVTAPAYYSHVKPGDPPVESSGYQPWNQKLEYLKVESATDNNGVTTVAVNASDTDNRNKNDVGSTYPGATNHNLLVTVTFQDGDKSHITGAAIVAH